MRKVDETSQQFGVLIVTLSEGAANPSSRLIRSCTIKPDSTNIATVYMGSSATEAQNGGYALPETDFPMPINNLNRLYFYSTQANAKVSILWRS